MSMWSVFVSRIVPDYSSRISSRNTLKRQYQEALHELETGGSFYFPEDPVNKDKLGDRVFQQFLKTRTKLENNGFNSGGEWHVADRDSIKPSLKKGMCEIKGLT
ncbi:hypothetical protein [Natrinema sp. SYSU A 869]|uniref:hypothetical protein n=1 Tax=Natrinema sp. SYSU A 869 TaxID=2871694 RepID=UPI001CA4591A|nr:hypothetical protein [Natrinema sp. SYSU A 869]